MGVVGWGRAGRPWFWVVRRLPQYRHPHFTPIGPAYLPACLPQIGAEYGAGRMLTGEVKGLLVDVLVELVERHKAARAAVSEDVVDAFMAVRPMTDLFG